MAAATLSLVIGISSRACTPIGGRGLSRVAASIISLMGVILTYNEPGPRGSGFNPVPRSVGDEVQAALLELLDAGTIRPIVGKTVPATESYVFSDFRSVEGVPTPFRIERYVDGLKIEETQFTTVRYNTSVKDEFFKP